MWDNSNKGFRYLIQTINCEVVAYCRNLDTIKDVINNIRKLDKESQIDNIKYELVDRKEKTIVVL